MAVGGDFFVCYLGNLASQSHSNNLGRSSNSKNPDSKKLLCDQSDPRKPPKKIQIKNLMSKDCSDRKFYENENLATLKLCWVDQVKFEF